MPTRLCIAADDHQTTTVPLKDGFSEVMGEGIFIIFQTEPNGTINQVVITEADLRKLLLRC